MSGPDPRRFVPVSQLYGSVARLLRGAAAVLALLFVVRVLFSLWNAGGGPPNPVLRFCDALVSQAPFAVMVVCLLALALLVDEQCRGGRQLARLLRGAAVPVAIGYLLLIPLYSSAQWWRSQAEARSARSGLQVTLRQLQGARQQVLQAASSDDLERILARLPAGSPPLERFGTDLPRQRRALLDFLDQVRRILLGRLQSLERDLNLILLRDAGMFSLACLGLAALFYRSSQLALPDAPPRRARTTRLPWSRRRGGAAMLERDVEELLASQGLLDSDKDLLDPEAGAPLIGEAALMQPDGGGAARQPDGHAQACDGSDSGATANGSWPPPRRPIAAIPAGDGDGDGDGDGKAGGSARRDRESSGRVSDRPEAP